MAKSGMTKKRTTLYFSDEIRGMADRLMVLLGYSSLNGFTEQLIRDEYERRFGEITARNPAAKAKLPKK
jgi:hypothetical protein